MFKSNRPLNLRPDSSEELQDDGANSADVDFASATWIGGVIPFGALSNLRQDQGQPLAADGQSAPSAPQAAAAWADVSTLADYLVRGYWGGTPKRYYWSNAAVTVDISHLNAAEQYCAKLADQLWHEVCNISFKYVTSGAAITYRNDGSGIAQTSSDGHTITISSDWSGGPKANAWSYFFQTYVHETGHALGLGHQGPYNATDNPAPTYGVSNIYTNDTWRWSIMSYFAQNKYGSDSADYVITPEMADIYAVQSIYGAPITRPGATTYGFNATGDASPFYNFATYSGAPAFTIYDSGGIDTIDASRFYANQSIDLTPGAWSSIGGYTHNIGIYLTTTIENAIGGVGADTIWGNGSGNDLRGGAGNDTIFGSSGDDTIGGGAGYDILDGGAGVDTADFSDEVSGFRVQLNGATSVAVTRGAATIDTIMNFENVIGGSGADTLIGDSNINRLVGGAGADWLEGGAGNDTLVGGAGNDVYLTQDSDTILENANEGYDTVRCPDSHILEANVEALVLLGTANIFGFGNALNNSIVGNAGNNDLRGGGGYDILAGGAGNDVYRLDDLSRSSLSIWRYDTINENANEGTDTVYVRALSSAGVTSPKGYTLGANIENGVVTGTVDFDLAGNELNNVLTGNAGANTLTGGLGADRLNGAAGLDVLVGGAGDDTYVLDDFTLSKILAPQYDAVVEAANEGTDTVIVTAFDINPFGKDGYKLGDNVENGTIAGALDFDLTGNALNNVLTGNSGANTLTGGDGADQLNGARGADVLIGGAGDDTYILNDVTPGVGMIPFYDSVVEAANGGNDTVIVTALVTNYLTLTGSYTLGANVENGTITGTLDFGLTGNDLDNTLQGNASVNRLTGGLGNDVLAGGAGNDILIGGLGNDTYITQDSDTITENANEGYDTVRCPDSHILEANVEALVLTGTGDTFGFGNELDNALTGNSGANDLRGGLGNDALVGGLGADTLNGGPGNDRFIYRATAESPSAASDRIVDFTLGDRIDLSAIDANTRNGAGNDAFSATIVSAFTGIAGQLMFTPASAANGNIGVLGGDVNGDGAADIMIRLTNVTTLGAASIIL